MKKQRKQQSKNITNETQIIIRHIKQRFFPNRISSRLHACGLAYRNIITSNTIRSNFAQMQEGKNNNNNNNSNNEQQTTNNSNNIEDGASSCKLFQKQKEVSKISK